MDEKIKNKSEFAEVNLKRIVDALLRKSWMIILLAVVGAAVVLLITYFMITPKYEASTMFYVNNNSISVGEATLSIDANDITASKSLVNTYIVILNTRDTLMDVKDFAQIKNRTWQDIRDMIHAEAVDETEIFKVVVTSEDKTEALKIAQAIAEILPNRISDTVEGTTAKVVENPVKATSPSSPNYTMNTLIGFLLGLVLGVGITVMQEMLDITIRKDDDLAMVCKHPILASVPDMNAPGKGSSYYGYGTKRSKKKKRGNYATAKTSAQPAGLLGGQLSFAASEAYKLLRTKLQFSFADDNDCRVIGISSALSGEGKSLTSVNLAFTLSQLDKKVLLIDCDMRRPTLAEKLGIMKTPGLSSYLTRQSLLEDLVQMCGLKNNENAFHVITAGQNPPNPIELLSSDRMKAALEAVRQRYDYVILDLPPVGEVSDAMAVANETDGILLVVRQNYCDRVSASEAVHQFEFIQAKILGVVFNCTSEHSGNYSKGYYKRYYRRYYHRYYRRYDNRYESSARSAAGAPAANKSNKPAVRANKTPGSDKMSK